LNRTSNVRRRAEQRRRELAKPHGHAGPEENAVSIRLIICGILFVLLVAVKLLFPEAASGLVQSAGKLIGRNADFKEAFAAVGRAISGEETVRNSLQDAYAAVFSPAAPNSSTAQPEPSATQTAPSDVSIRNGLEPGGRLVRYTTPKLPEADLDTVRETVVDLDQGTAQPAQPEEPDDSDDTATTQALSYVYTMPALPNNASLEQRNLGFNHCTPVYGTLTSPFGWREHPIEGGNKFHYGVDLAAAEGSDIAAFAAGTVYATGESSSLGNYIMLQHDGGYITLYAHCSKVTATGGSIAMGEKIAEVGSTGLATGPHLHFELHDGDLYLNPIYYVDIG